MQDAWAPISVFLATIVRVGRLRVVHSTTGFGSLFSQLIKKQKATKHKKTQPKAPKIKTERFSSSLISFCLNQHDFKHRNFLDESKRCCLTVFTSPALWVVEKRHQTGRFLPSTLDVTYKVEVFLWGGKRLLGVRISLGWALHCCIKMKVAFAVGRWE